jgi:hypothetical protein
MGELSESDFILSLALCYKLRIISVLIGLCLIMQMLVWNAMCIGNVRFEVLAAVMEMIV